MHGIYLYLPMKIFQHFTYHHVKNFNIYKHKFALKYKFKQSYHEVVKIVL